VRGAPGLHAVGGHGKARGQHGIRLLEDVAHFHVFLRAASDDFIKILLDLAVDDEDDLLKTRFQRVIERIVHDDFAVAPDGIDLFEPAVAAAHACCHDDKSGFLHT